MAAYRRQWVTIYYMHNTYRLFAFRHEVYTSISYLSIANSTMVYMDVDSVTVFMKGMVLQRTSPNTQYVWMISMFNTAGTVTMMNKMSATAKFSRNTLVTVRMRGFLMMTKHTSMLPVNHN